MEKEYKNIEDAILQLAKSSKQDLYELAKETGKYLFERNKMEFSETMENALKYIDQLEESRAHWKFVAQMLAIGCACLLFFLVSI